MQSVQRLVSTPLTAAAFSQFGEIIDIPHDCVHIDINNLSCQRFDGLGHIDVEGQAGLSIFRAQARQLPFNIELLERHPLGSQAFMPMAAAKFIVVVAPDKNDSPDWDNIQAFSASQGINFYRNIWHHPLITVDRPSDFLVIDRLNSNKGTNLEEVTIPDNQFKQLIG